jgi:methyl-accepting chemotaxis protein
VSLTLTKKVYASFGVVLVLLAGVAGAALWAFTRMSASTHQIAEVAAVKAQDANTMIGLGAYIHESQTRFVLTRNASYSDHLGDVRVFDAGLAALSKLSVSSSDKGHLARIGVAVQTVSRFDSTLHADVLANHFGLAERTVQGPANDAADALAGAAQEYQNAALKEQASAVSQFAATRSLANLILGVITGLAVVVALTLAYLLLRGVLRPLAQITVAAERIAERDLEVEISVDSNDEIGRMARAFGASVAYLREIAAAASELAAGNLTVQVAPKSERDVLGRAFGAMRDKLAGMLAQISHTSQTLSAASRQMAQTSDEAGRAVGEIAQSIAAVAEGTETQVRSLERARQMTEEVAQATQTSATSAGETATAAEQARAVAGEGAATVAAATKAMRAVKDTSSQVTGAIRQLGAKSEQIGGIVATITGIAEQTNLLALNAAIEAARAGEQGRGFAVVAEEVRKLAEESQKAAATIGSLINEIQVETGKAVEVVERGARQTEEGANTVELAREAFERIDTSVEDMNGRVTQITAAIQQIAASGARMQQSVTEVAGVAEQTAASTQQVSASTQQTSASTQQIAANAQELAHTANELEQLVGEFTLS